MKPETLRTRQLPYLEQITNYSWILISFFQCVRALVHFLLPFFFRVVRPCTIQYHRPLQHNSTKLGLHINKLEPPTPLSLALTDNGPTRTFMNPPTHLTHPVRHPPCTYHISTKHNPKATHQRQANQQYHHNPQNITQKPITNKKSPTFPP